MEMDWPCLKKKRWTPIGKRKRGRPKKRGGGQSTKNWNKLHLSCWSQAAKQSADRTTWRTLVSALCANGHEENLISAPTPPYSPATPTTLTHYIHVCAHFPRVPSLVQSVVCLLPSPRLSTVASNVHIRMRLPLSRVAKRNRHAWLSARYSLFPARSRRKPASR